MFFLVMNPMSGRKDERVAVMKANTAEELQEILAQESVAPYDDIVGDKVWMKRFRRSGPLEWMNLPMEDPIVEVTEQKLIDEVVSAFRETVKTIPSASEYVFRPTDAALLMLDAIRVKP